MRVIFLSGPPRSGKDTAAQIILRELGDRAQVMRLSDTLKEMAHRAYRISGVGVDAFEEFKDQPREEFWGVTPRQAYIGMFKAIEHAHGDGLLGEALSQRVWELGPGQVAVVPDLGRLADAVLTVEQAEPGEVVHLRLDRPGTSFAGDSRVAVDLGILGVTTRWVYNSGTVEELGRTIKDLLCAAG